MIDDNSADGSTDDLPCPVLRIPYLRKQGFEPARMGLLAGISAGLLEAYDAVMFCDADEFVVAEPRTHESLRHFVAARPGARPPSACSASTSYTTCPVRRRCATASRSSASAGSRSSCR